MISAARATRFWPVPSPDHGGVDGAGERGRQSLWCRGYPAEPGSPPGSGALFGLAVAPHGSGLYFVDDAVNTLRLLH